MQIKVPLFPMRIRRRWPALYFLLLLLGAAVAGGFYIYDIGFHQKYRQLIADELAPYGLRAEIARLTLDPVEGLTARNVTLYPLLPVQGQGPAAPVAKLASISRISLDIDFGRLMSRTDFLRSLTLQQASISMPVDPDDPASEWIHIRDLDARLVMEGRKINILRLEGLLAGIRLRATGDLTRPEKKVEQPQPPTMRQAELQRRIKSIRERRGVLRSALRVLERCQVVEDTSGSALAPFKGDLELECHGPLADPSEWAVRAVLKGGHIQCGKFQAKDYSAEASYVGGELLLRKLNITDEVGTLAASATWTPAKSSGLDLSLDSSVDLIALVKGLHPTAQLPEDIQFVDPPHLRAEGTYLLGQPFTPGSPPLHLTGSVTLGGFRLQGHAYQRFHTDFAVREDGFLYLRKTTLSHRSGTISGQLLMDDASVRYDAEGTISPQALQPLLTRPEAQQALAIFQLVPESLLDIKSSGRQNPEDGTWTHEGKLDIRDAALRGHRLRQLTTDFALQWGSVRQLTLRRALIRREDGEVSGQEAYFDLDARTLRLTDAATTTYPASTVSMFAPQIGVHLEKYRFMSPPRARADGLIDLTPQGRSDLQIRFETPGDCSLPIGSQVLRLATATGSVHLLGPQLRLDISSRVQPDQSFAGIVRCVGPAPGRLLGTFGLLKTNQDATRYKVRIRPEAPLVVTLAGKAFPIEQADATLTIEQDKLNVQSTGLVYNGRVGIVLDFPQLTQPQHTGRLTMDRSSFSRLSAALGAEGSTTGGFLTAQSQWRMTGSTGDTIEGSGTTTLEDGDIFSLPMLGPLSGLISSLLPGGQVVYSVARKATASFTLADGVLTFPDFETSTRTFKLVGNITADFMRDAVDGRARVNLRGVPGLLLYPVSKLFEYKAEGTPGKTAWKPLYVDSPLDILKLPGRMIRDLDKTLKKKPKR